MGLGITKRDARIAEALQSLRKSLLEFEPDGKSLLAASECEMYCLPLDSHHRSNGLPQYVLLKIRLADVYNDLP